MNILKRNTKEKVLVSKTIKKSFSCFKCSPIIVSVVITSLLAGCGAGNSSGMTNNPTTNNYPVKLSIIPSPAKVASVVWKDTTNKKVAGLSEYERSQVKKVLELTNKYRAEVGKPPLKWDENLAAYAQVRSQEIIENFDHIRPDGTSSFSEIDFSRGGTVGENIAVAQGNAEEVSLGWKNSPGHYENIINGNFDRIGIGLVQTPSHWGYHWTQTFAGGNAQGAYEFDNSKIAKQPDVIKILGEKITLSADNKVVLNGGENITSNASLAYSKGPLRHLIYGKSLKYSDGDFDIIVQDPSLGGFAYQTFAEVIDSAKSTYYPVQYVNIGYLTPTDKITSMNAIYRGVSLGSVAQKTHFYSDVVAKVNDKNMQITFSNAKISCGNDVCGFAPSPEQRGINFTENMYWDSSNAQFVQKNSETGDYVQAKFYGPNAEEIGGQFERNIKTLGIYQGAFGAKKE